MAITEMELSMNINNDVQRFLANFHSQVDVAESVLQAQADLVEAIANSVAKSIVRAVKEGVS